MLLILLLICGVFARPDIPFAAKAFTKDDMITYRDEVKDLIYFGIDKYLELAYPADEIDPLDCTPAWRNFDDVLDFGTNDAMGNFSLTLIESLTTVAVIGDRDKFKQLVDLVEESLPNKFDTGTVVQVFETTIRVLGSLMSSHLFATDPTKKVYLGEEYNGFLLDLAVDLADRLLPAYLTDHGIPYPRVNLSNPEPLDLDFNFNNNIVAMSAPYFEFRMLSYLTMDSKYEEVTKFSFEKAWDMRSAINLVPPTMDPFNDNALEGVTGVGASLDSFYEYALKGAILFDDDNLLKVWREVYSAINVYSKEDWFYTVVSYWGGYPMADWIDALAAFFPGLQVLAGDIDDAMAHNMMYMKLWDTYGAIPERWFYDKSEGKEFNGPPVQLEWYPLRPEFIESTWYLYRATKDPFFLNIGTRVLLDYQTKFKTSCGFAALKDVITGEYDDRMESFVLSETLKYLYLLFDEDNELHKDRNNVIFSTEAHPLWVTPEMRRDYEANKYFNDTVYIEYLDRVKKKTEDRKRSERTEKIKQIYEFQKYFIKYEAPIKAKDRKEVLKKLLTKKETMDRFTDLEYVQQPHVYDEFNNTCRVTKYDSSRNNAFFSPIMSTYTKLFEINRKYQSTLQKPKYLQHHPQLDIEDTFYSRWCPQNATSEVPTTGITFDVLFESIGDYDIIRYFNGSVSGENFNGNRKLRVQKLKRGDIDYFGDLVTDEDFENLDFFDIRKGHLMNDNLSKIHVMDQEIYRIIKLDSIVIPKGQDVYISRRVLDDDFDIDDVIADPYIHGKKKAFSKFGYTKDGHLVSENVLYKNFKLI